MSYRNTNLGKTAAASMAAVAGSVHEGKLDPSWKAWPILTSLESLAESGKPDRVWKAWPSLESLTDLDKSGKPDRVWLLV